MPQNPLFDVLFTTVAKVRNFHELCKYFGKFSPEIFKYSCIQVGQEGFPNSLSINFNIIYIIYNIYNINIILISN